MNQNKDVDSYFKNTRYSTLDFEVLTIGLFGNGGGHGIYLPTIVNQHYQDNMHRTITSEEAVGRIDEGELFYTAVHKEITPFFQFFSFLAV